MVLEGNGGGVTSNSETEPGITLRGRRLEYYRIRSINQEQCKIRWYWCFQGELRAKNRTVIVVQSSIWDAVCATGGRCEEGHTRDEGRGHDGLRAMVTPG